MGAPPEILLLLDGESRSQGLVRVAGAAARLRVLRWDRVTGEDLTQPDLKAVLFEPSDTASDWNRREALRRQVPA